MSFEPNDAPTTTIIKLLGGYSATFLEEVETHVDNVTFTALPDFECYAVEILNNTAEDLIFKRTNSVNTYTLPPQTAKLFGGISNANELSVVAAAQVTLNAIEAYVK